MASTTYADVPTNPEDLIEYLRPLNKSERFSAEIVAALSAKLGGPMAGGALAAGELLDDAIQVLDHESRIGGARQTLITTVADADGYVAEAADLLAELVGDDLDDMALAGTIEGTDAAEHLRAAARELRAALRALRAATAPPAVIEMPAATPSDGDTSAATAAAEAAAEKYADGHGAEPPQQPHEVVGVRRVSLAEPGRHPGDLLTSYSADQIEVGELARELDAAEAAQDGGSR